MKICQNCGAEVSDTAKFCRKCGMKIEVPAPDTTEPLGTVSADAASSSSATKDEERIVAADKADAAYAGGEWDEPTAVDQPLEEEGATDYQWGPPTGGENYDEPAMPAVFVRDAEEERQEKKPEPEPYTYQLDAPGYDHTEEFEPKDISDNKVTSMAAYLLGPLGVIIALLAGQDSPYAKFHMRQGLKFLVVEALVSVISVLLCWTLIVPAAAMIFMIILGVIKIITFISVCRGKAVEPAIIRSMGFLK